MPGDSIKPQRIQPCVTTVLCGPGSPPRKLRLALNYVPADEVQRLLRVWKLEAIPEGNGFHELVDEIGRDAREEAAQLGLSARGHIPRAHNAGGWELGRLPLRYAAARLDISPWVNMFVEPVPSIPSRPRLGMARMSAKGLTGKLCLDPASTINTLRIRR